MLRITRLAGIGLAMLIFGAVLLISVHRIYAGDQTIDVGDEWFCNPGDSACMNTTAGNIDVTSNINVGDTVTWNWVGQLTHTTTACSSDFSTCGATQGWDSSPAKSSGTFSHTFGPGDVGKTFFYQCEIHTINMRGQINVAAQATA